MTSRLRALVCHSSSKTADVPGNLVRSVYPDKAGLPIFSAGTYNTNHESPFSQRWGGWYVSGRHGKQTHMGNICVQDKDNPEKLDTAAGANVTDLSSLFDVQPYLTPHSDLIALMTLEHQSHMHNLLTRSGYDARMALWYNDALNKAFGEPATHRSESTTRRLKNPAESLLRYTLFVDEAPLADAIEGTSGFAVEFSQRGPRDSKGRSLREFVCAITRVPVRVLMKDLWWFIVALISVLLFLTFVPEITLFLPRLVFG